MVRNAYVLTNQLEMDLSETLPGWPMQSTGRLSFGLHVRRLIPLNLQNLPSGSLQGPHSAPRAVPVVVAGSSAVPTQL